MTVKWLLKQSTALNVYMAWSEVEKALRLELSQRVRVVHSPFIHFIYDIPIKRRSR